MKRQRDEDDSTSDSEEGDNEKQKLLDERLDCIRKKYINRQKVLILCSRGITYRYRHLMLDFLSILPHSRKDSKMDSKKNLQMINEAAEMRNCTYAVFFDVRKGTNLYIWMSRMPNGPTIKFQVLNGMYGNGVSFLVHSLTYLRSKVHTMNELNFTGNCLKGSRAVLSFSPKFDKKPHTMLMKEMISQIFNVPNYHPRCRPFVDHTFSFSLIDNKIWFRHYQVLEEYDFDQKKNVLTLVEIGPRFVLNPIFILSNSFYGPVIWENPYYISPVFMRKMQKQAKVKRAQSKIQQKSRKRRFEHDFQSTVVDPLDQVFSNK